MMFFKVGKWLDTVEHPLTVLGTGRKIMAVLEGSQITGGGGVDCIGSVIGALLLRDTFRLCIYHLYLRKER